MKKFYNNLQSRPELLYIIGWRAWKSNLTDTGENIQK